MIRIIAGLIFVFFAEVASAAVVVEYGFDGNSLDTSGNSENLTLFNGATYGAGYAGQALVLDGVDDYAFVNIGNYGLTNFTVEAWINVPTYNSNLHYVSLYQDNYIVLGDYNAGPISTWAGGLNPDDAGGSGAAIASPSINEWHHIAFTYDGANQNIYLDGVLQKSVATVGTLTSDPALYNTGLAIGARHTQIEQYVQGSIDNVRIHDVALSAAQLGFFQDLAGPVAVATSVPTLSEMGVFMLILLLLSTAYLKQRRS